jgi:hypothetical protein
MFDHVPDFWALVGMGLVALCGVAGGLLTLHEMRVRKNEGPVLVKTEPCT